MRNGPPRETTKSAEGKALSVRKVRVDSVADLEALPEGEWVVAPAGINVPFEYEPIRMSGRSLRIRLSPSMLRRLRPKRGRRLTARISGGELVVEEAR